MTEHAVLFLDFDGVLHPGDVYLVKGKPVLRRDGIALFEWVNLLEDALLPYLDQVDIVLSTTWVAILGLNEAKRFLPEALQKRVIGATFDGSHEPQVWGTLPRCTQIQIAAKRLACDRWIAVDDDTDGWNPEFVEQLVAIDPDLGLAEAGRVEELQRKLKQVLTLKK